jgi:nucleoside-diphosphate-sugar epimerase
MLTKALVTGCAGFVGSHLAARLLLEGFEVTGIDCFTDYYPREVKEKNISEILNREKFNLIEKDILQIEEFPEVDYVFHQAAQAGVRGSWGKNFEIYIRNNIWATQRLLEFYKDREIGKFVFASSSSVYGDVELPMREDSILRPLSPYGVTKLAAENLGYLYYRNYQVPTVSLRYFTVYGPGQRPDMAINRFVRAVINGETISIYGDGKQTRDFTYVEDVVESNILAARSNLAGEVFNVGGGSRISVNELIAKIERAAAKKTRLEYIEKQRGDVKDTLADTGKAREKLRWQPKVRIEEGLERYVSWVRDQTR